MDAHAKLLINQGHIVSIIAGRGEQTAIPQGAKFIHLPIIDSLHPTIIEMNRKLEQGIIPDDFGGIKQQLVDELSTVLADFNTVIVHNVFTKHFNLPLTAALFSLLNENKIMNCIAWSHDFTWTSPNSRSKVFDGDPWSLLKTYRKDIQHVVVSQARQQELAGLYGIDPELIHVVYNGVDPSSLLGLSAQTKYIADQCNLLDSELNLLMPVRVTQAKNIEFALHTLAALKENGFTPTLILTGPPDPHDSKSMHYYFSLRELRKKLCLQKNMFFIYELKTLFGNPLTIPLVTVGELFRLSDILFMPSHREGFGMPIVEAGLSGLGIFSAPIPAAVEIGLKDIHLIDINKPAKQTAQQIAEWCQLNKQYKMRKKIRQKFTWKAIYHNQIEPLIHFNQAKP